MWTPRVKGVYQPIHREEKNHETYRDLQSPTIADNFLDCERTKSFDSLRYLVEKAQFSLVVQSDLISHRFYNIVDSSNQTLACIACTMYT
jgi:hypothetical protein